MDIETLLGMNAGSGADMRALAAKLRGQQQLGSALSLSTLPQVAAMGAAERGAAEQAASRGGALRMTQAAQDEAKRRFEEQQAFRQERAGVSDARYAGEQARLVEQRDYERGARGAAEVWASPDGEQVVVQRVGNDYVDQATGQPVDLSGFRPAPSAGRGYRGVRRGMKREDPYGNEVSERADGSWWFGNVPWTEEEARRRGEIRQGYEAGAAGSETFEKEGSKRRQEAIGDVQETQKVSQQAIAEFQNAITALDAGAWTGPIARLMPTLRTQSLALDQARNRLAMSKIAEYTFGSLSEAEADWLRSSTIDVGQLGEQLRADLTHEIENLKRFDQVGRYVMGRLRQNKDPEREEMDRILHAGGHSLARPPRVESQAPAMPQQGELVQHSGKTWEFLGGDPKDPSRWRETP